VSPGSGAATWSLTNVPLADHTSIPNSFADDPIPAVPAALNNLTIQWSSGGTRVTYTDNANFIGNFVANTATIACQATVPGRNFVFATDNAPETTVFAIIGHERNGVFFS